MLIIERKAVPMDMIRGGPGSQGGGLMSSVSVPNGAPSRERFTGAVAGSVGAPQEGDPSLRWEGFEEALLSLAAFPAPASRPALGHFSRD